MIIQLVLENENRDFDGPVIDIFFNDIEEAFEMGRLFEKTKSLNKCIWYGKGKIRIPLIDAQMLLNI